MKKIVFVAQVPPPYGGQSIMLEKILEGKYSEVRLYHVRMSFSKEMNEIGKASLYKVLHLAEVIFKIYYFRIVKNAKVLYYPPAGPDKTPIVRDIVILMLTRWLFQKTIFHFHAGGLSEVSLHSRILRFFFSVAYKGVDCAILLSDLNPADGKNLNAKREIVIPYGIADYSETIQFSKTQRSTVKILFVAVIRESKGILDLLQACQQLKTRGLDFKLEIMGKFESAGFELFVKKLIQDLGITNQVSFLGVRVGTPKFLAYADADIFCFPTFFESETFGVVLLEAMQFSLPVVASAWRGIPSIVSEGESGFLVQPKNSDELAKKLAELIVNPILRIKMGKAGRSIFLAKFTLATFHQKMEQAFKSC
jgi:glycosyltransferase involved in cell wall biosynthesis